MKKLDKFFIKLYTKKGCRIHDRATLNLNIENHFADF